MACPHPGPPCYTEKSSSGSGQSNFQNNGGADSRLLTEIGWKRKYFSNPIISTEKIEARILDANRKQTLVEYKEVQFAKNQSPQTGYFYFEPQNIESLHKEKMVVYQLIDSEGTHEFMIQIL